MASTFTDLGLELMATGENAGTWGTKTNANLSLIEQLTGGVLSLAIAGSGTTALDIDNGALTGTAQQRVIEFTGALTGSRIITFPLLTETFYIIKNGTTGAETLQLKAASGSGATVTFSTTDKGYKLIYLDGVATNTGVIDVGMATITGTQTLTNKSIDSDNNTITNIVDADIKASAAIAFSKMANLTTSRALVSDGSGDVSAATTTSTEIGYVNGVTSAIQTQINTKTSTGKAIAMAMLFG